jgi:acetyl-CoA acetyltransferase family protein
MDYVIAGGVESMSRVPMFSDIQGGFEKLNPKLLAKYEIIHQGLSAERIAEKYHLSRKQLDEFSFYSHKKAGHATQEGFFSKQLIPYTGKDKQGNPTKLEWDEGIRLNPDLEKMALLPTIFKKEGVITAANASQISDGAAAVLIGDREKAKSDGLKPKARFVARVAVGGDPTYQLLEVIPATIKALHKAKLNIKDIDIIEINEAFASVVLAWAAEIKPDMERVNPNGGAIAHGHPLGATGAALMTKLVYELERKNKQFGLQVMCIGHGMATATIIERI